MQQPLSPPHPSKPWNSPSAVRKAVCETSVERFAEAPSLTAAGSVLSLNASANIRVRDSSPRGSEACSAPPSHASANRVQ
jgi:hypothetical protein